MAIALTSTGLEIDSLQDNLQTMVNEMHAGISPTLNLSSTSVLGQLLGIFASQLQQVKEAAQLEYASQDPQQATGAALERHTRLVGVERNPATYSRALLDITLATGTYPAGDLVVHVTGDATKRFANASTITTLGATLTSQEFLAETAGPVRANAGTLTVIANPVVGFSNPNNPLDAELGAEAESDSALRARWKQELARRGSTTVDAIRADVLQVSDFVRVYENDGDSTDVNGLPGHSFEVLVLGGTDAAIADAIFLTKPAGIRAYGSTVVAVTDSQGSGHSIGFSRPTDVNIYLAFQVNYLAGQFIGADALKQILADWGDENLGPGNDVIMARLIQVVMDQPGVVDCDMHISNAPIPPGDVGDNYPIGVREIARLDTSRITITAVAVLGAP